MSGAKETPRQKMIGMMYLVLTAMLALNVSTAILKSFLIVNDSIESTNQNFESKIESTYNIFEKALLENKEKVQQNYDKAQKAKELTEEFRTYVLDAKAHLIATAAKIPDEQAKTLSAHDIARQDDYDTPTLIFIEQGKGKELREKIDAYEKAMLELLPEDAREHIKSAFNTAGPFYDASKKTVSWEVANFYQSIIVAAITILNKLENDAMNLEYDVVNSLYNLVSASDLKFDNVVAKIVPKSTFVTLGEPFEAEVFLVAFDSKTRISAHVNGQTLNSKDGVINYISQTSKEGIFTVSGAINLPGSGGAKNYPFKTEYVVASPSAAVSADAMNVFYIGVDNPISTSVSGVDPSSVTPTITNGTLTKASGGGNYIARVEKPGEAVVTLSVKSANGTMKNAGSFKFRVKRVPDPVALVNGVDEYTTIVDKNILANSGGLRAFMKDFDFKLDLRVSSFTMSTVQGGDFKESKSTSNRFTNEMTTLMKNARKGQKFFFEDIKCQMPTGMSDLRSIVLTIK